MLEADGSNRDEKVGYCIWAKQSDLAHICLLCEAFAYRRITVMCLLLRVIPCSVHSHHFKKQKITII